MTVKELIFQLEHFNPDFGVCVEVTEETALKVMRDGDGTQFLDLDCLSPECRAGNSIKLKLV